MDLRPQTLPIDKVGSSVWFRRGIRHLVEKIMFIKDDIQDAYFEAYWGTTSWDTWDDLYLIWPELNGF